MPAKQDPSEYIGKRYFNITIIREIGLVNKKRYVVAICDCSKEFVAMLSSIKHGDYKSCGCIKCGPKIEELIGQRFGKLTIIGEGLRRKGRKRRVNTKCDCGKIVEVDYGNLKVGTTTSCGCYAKQHVKEIFTTHGLTNHLLYGVWCNIKGRCYNTKAPSYANYGGRGIALCDEWVNDFLAFYDWAIANGWEHGLEIDRIDNDGIYSPENCRCVSSTINSRNKRSNIWLEYNGERMVIADWSIKLGMPASTIYARVRMGLPHSVCLRKYKYQSTQ